MLFTRIIAIIFRMMSAAAAAAAAASAECRLDCEMIAVRLGRGAGECAVGRPRLCADRLQL